MPTLSSLLLRLEALHHQRFLLDSQIDDLKREIIASHKPETKRRKRPPAAEVAELIRGVIRVLREAGEPLPCSEIATRLSLSASVAHYRLRKALAAGFIEKAGGARYRASSAIAAL